MKKSEIEVGGVYTAKVSDQVVEVRIDGAIRSGGWNATNLATNKRIHIKSPARLRARVRTTAAEMGGIAQANEENPRREDEGVAASDGATGSQRAMVATKPAEEKRMSGLDAAARVLAESSEPMSAKQMVETADARGYWKSPGGKTPHATLYSAIIREIATKGAEARFRKTERGKFIHA